MTAAEHDRLTGEACPHPPPTAGDSRNAGLPWFDYAAGNASVSGTTPLTGVKSVNDLVTEKIGLGLGDNESVAVKNVKKLGPRKDAVVREF